MKNEAAWLPHLKARPFKVDEAPVPTPEPHEIVVRNRAVAINPADWAVQALGVVVEKYPIVPGCDGAGDVVAVGDAVSKFRVGDRVTALYDGCELSKATNGAFQLFAATNAGPAAKLPDSISYVQGAVLPLGMMTATAGLFDKNTLALPYPQKCPEPSGKVVLVWGGSSSVGACAIQLARGAGFEVATTASARNHDLCTSLGAKYVFDHTKESIEEDIVNALQGVEFAGVFIAVIDGKAIRQSARVASRVGGNKFVSTVLAPGMPLPDDMPSDVKVSTYSSSPARNEIGEYIWGEWIPAALKDGSLVCKPDPLVVGHGVDQIQVGVDKWKEGVSGQKIVVKLP